MGSTFNSLVGLIILALDIWAILNVIKSGSEVGIKVLWILLIALLPVVGLVMAVAMWGLAPFGPGNPEPVFAIAEARVERPMMLKGGHVRCTLTDASGGRLKAVAWRAGETDLGDRIMAGGGGTRLHPLSRPERPKPFLPLLGDRSLLQATAARPALRVSTTRSA